MISNTKIKFNADLMHFMSVFGAITKTDVKDCFEHGGRLVFVVPEGQIGKAIGKKGINIKKLENKFKKRIKIVEFSNNVVQFVKNLIAPIKADEITEEDGIITIKGNDTKSKGLLIGRESQNLRKLESIVSRHFKIKGIKVV